MTDVTPPVQNKPAIQPKGPAVKVPAPELTLTNEGIPATHPHDSSNRFGISDGKGNLPKHYHAPPPSVLVRETEPPGPVAYEPPSIATAHPVPPHVA
jgi:hypothetical protein